MQQLIMYRPAHRLDNTTVSLFPAQRTRLKILPLLFRTGTDREIKNAGDRGVPVIGICGGYQMLGKTLIDAGFESAAGTYEGLGLLDGITRFSSYDKTTTQVPVLPVQCPPSFHAMGEVTGYEIHMGITEPGRNRKPCTGMAG